MMRVKHIRGFFFILFLIMSTAFVSAGTGRLAVFPYFAVEGALAEEYGYALFLVPDMIKIKLMESGRFSMIENSEIDEAAEGMQLEDEYYRDEELCTGIAESLEADYYIRGYLYSDQQQLTVVHSLVSVADGRILHIERQRLPEGRELLELLDHSSEMFAEWVNKELPDPEPSVVVIERETIVEYEKLVEVEVEVETPRADFQLAAGAGYHFYLFNSAQYLESNLSFNIGFLFQHQDWDFFSVGFSLLFEALNEKQAFYDYSEQNIDVVMIPLLLSGRFSVPLNSVIGIEGGVGLGGALVFGFVEPDIFAGFRPALAAEAGILLFPEAMVSIGFRGSFSATFFAYEQIHLFTVYPVVDIKFNF